MISIIVGYLLPLLLAPALAVNKEPRPPTRTTETDPEERWLNVRVNHMMAANNDTFPMRFYYNQLPSQTADNVVIVVGGDWDISADWAAGGLAVDIANNIRASLFYTEHRFYGQSRLADDTTLSHLRFLTVDQTLGDLAQFINHIKSDDFLFGRYKSAKVVLVGCSLGGSLATWMRLSHPHLVQAVVSDGGPLYARDELPEYLEVLSEVLRVRGGDSCVQSVEQAVADVRAAVATPAGLGHVSQLFNTCTPFTAALPLDEATFWVGIIDTFAALVRDDIDDVPAACAALSAAGSSPMERLAAWLRRRRPGSCLNALYSDLVADLSDTSYNSSLVHSRLWLYAACSQYGWVPAARAAPADYYHRLCADVFAGRLNRDTLRSGVSRTNLLFAGVEHLPDYVVSVRGTLDPYFSAGPNGTHATTKAPVYVAYNAPRCSALSSLADSPTEENIALKINVLNDIQYFIHGTLFAGAARAVTSAVLFLGVVIATII